MHPPGEPLAVGDGHPQESEPAERRPCPPSGLHLQLQEAGAAAQWHLQGQAASKEKNVLSPAVIPTGIQTPSARTPPRTLAANTH